MIDDLYDDDDEGPIDGVLIPPRHVVTTRDLDEVARLDAGGKLAQMRAAGTDHRKDFVLLRGPLGAIRLSLAHAPALLALWRVWSGKRLRQEGDPGASLAEIAEAMGLDPKAVRPSIVSLLKNRVIRSKVVHVGWRGTRATYYPSDVGVQALALAEVLGPGNSVQVGRRASAWGSRRQSEPGDLFKHAALLRGGAHARAYDSEYS